MGLDQQVSKGLGSAGRQGIGISRCAGGWNQQGGETLELRHTTEHGAGLLKAALHSRTSTNASFVPYTCQQLGAICSPTCMPLHPLCLLEAWLQLQEGTPLA